MLINSDDDLATSCENFVNFQSAAVLGKIFAGGLASYHLGGNNG